MRVSYSYRDNGRGPDIEEEISLAADGTFRSYRQRGKTTFGAMLDERFSASRGRAQLALASSEQGARKLEGAVIYLPTYGSPEVSAIIVRATQKAPGGRLAALPGGELRSTKLAGSAHRPGRAGARRRAVCNFRHGPAAGLRLARRRRRHAPLRQHQCRRSANSSSPASNARHPNSSSRSRKPESAYLRDIAKKQRTAAAQARSSSATCACSTPRPRASASLRTSTSTTDASRRSTRRTRRQQDAATVIDGAGRALLPGLFDMHTHEDAWNADPADRRRRHDFARHGHTTMPTSRSCIADIAPRRRDRPAHRARRLHRGRKPLRVARRLRRQRASRRHRTRSTGMPQRGYRQIKLYNSIKPEWVAPIADLRPLARACASAATCRLSRAPSAWSATGYDELQHINQLMLNFVSDPDTDSRTLARFILVGERARQLDLDSQASARLHRAPRRARDGHRRDPRDLRGHVHAAARRHGPVIGRVADHLPFATQRGWRNNSMDVSGGKLETYRASWKRMMEFFGRLHAAGRAARGRHGQHRGLHAAPRTRALRPGGHGAWRGDPHRDRERRALRGCARGPRHDRARQARRPDPGRRRPDEEHLRHPPRQLRAERRRRLFARRTSTGRSGCGASPTRL